MRKGYHVPLYIRDETVNDLADKLAREAGMSKTDAVRKALEHELDALSRKETLAQRVAHIQERAYKMGLRPRQGSDKAFMDELSGDI